MNPYKIKVTLKDTDAAGVIFFVNYFTFFHQAFESFLETAGISLAKMIADNIYLLPIVNAQADYKTPIFLGDIIQINITIDKIGKSSFTLLSHFIKNGKIAAGSVKTTHVSVNAKTRKTIPLPKDLRSALLNISLNRP